LELCKTPFFALIREGDCPTNLYILTSVCVTSILRITTLNIATSHKDTTWNSIASSMWTVIESNLGIICASMPALKRPISILFPSLFARVKETITGGKKSTAVKSSPISTAEGRQSGSHGSSSDDTYVLGDVEGNRESQDPILRAKEGYETAGGITKTVELSVEYDNGTEHSIPHGSVSLHSLLISLPRVIQ